MKRRIFGLFSFAAYWLGIDAIFYFLNKKAKRVITFHNILPDSLSLRGVANGVSTTLDDFRKIIDECARRFRFSLDMRDSGALTITFDDGYSNQYDTAFKELKARGIPAYLFVSGDCLGGGALTIDRLTHWIDCVPDGTLIDLGGWGGVTISSVNRFEVWAKTIWPAFIADSADKGANVLAALDKAYPFRAVWDALGEEYCNARLRGVTVEQCGKMREAGWAIGWHTQSHYPLSQLSEAEMRREVAPPSGMECTAFSFPYGNDGTVGAREIEFAESAGYPCAVSNTVESSNCDSRWFMPRIALPAEKYALHMELSGLKHFLKTRKLLPVAKWTRQ